MASCVAMNALSLAPARTVVTVRRAARASPRSRVVLVRAADAPDLSVGGAKALKSKEKKHGVAGLPLLGTLHAAETLCGGDGGSGLHSFLDTTLLRAFKEPRHR